MLDTFVNSTLDLYTVICKQLLPTPHKSHYTYNVRDLGKVFQGMLMMNPAKIEVGKARSIAFASFINLTDYCNAENTRFVQYRACFFVPMIRTLTTGITVTVRNVSTRRNGVNNMLVDAIIPIKADTG